MSMLDLIKESPFKRLIDLGYTSVKYNNDRLSVFEGIDEGKESDCKFEATRQLLNFVVGKNYSFYYNATYGDIKHWKNTSNLTDDIAENLLSLIKGKFDYVKCDGNSLVVGVYENVETGENTYASVDELGEHMKEFISWVVSLDESYLLKRGSRIDRYGDETATVTVAKNKRIVQVYMKR